MKAAAKNKTPNTTPVDTTTRDGEFECFLGGELFGQEYIHTERW